MSEETESEFGKGLVICLVKFAEHASKLSHLVETYKKVGLEESEAVSLWGNGATDHLYEIEVPEGSSWDEIREKVTKLKNVGLDLGHGFERKKEYSVKDAIALMDLTQEIALMIDMKLGLKAEKGRW